MRGASQPGIAAQLGLRLPQVCHIIQAHRQAWGYRSKEQLRQINLASHFTDRSRDEAYFDERRLETERDQVFQEFVGRAAGTLVLSDIHGAYRHHEVLDAADKAIDEHGLDTAVIVGDVLDQQAASRFLKFRHIPLDEEVVEAAGIVRHLALRVKRVIICKGNHDMRAARKLADRAPEVAMSKRIQKALNFLDEVVNGQTNVTALESWWFKMGNVVFCHREKYTKQERTTGESNLRYFENRGVEDIGLIVQAHVHRTCYFPLKMGTWYLENPMGCYRPDYTYESRSLDAILVAGYSVVQIGKDGKFDPNRTRSYFVNWQ